MITSIRKGFTLVEMLVVIAIIGILAGLLLPAVQATRAVARNMACRSNMGQIGKAAIDYAGIHKGRVPGWQEPMANTPVSWYVVLLPHLDQQNVYSMWQSSLASGTNPASGSNPQLLPKLGIMVCPAIGPQQPNGTSYVGNAGIAGGYQQDSTYHGMMHDHFNSNQRTRLEDVQDGLSYTALVSENVVAAPWYIPNKNGNCFVWLPSSPSITVINAPNLNAPLQSNGSTSRPSSYHQGGANIVFCDGRARYVRQVMSYNVYRQLMTPSGVKSDQILIKSGMGSANPVQVLSEDML